MLSLAHHMGVVTSTTLGYPSTVEIVSPERYIDIYKSQRSNIVSAQVIPGQLGGELGGHIIVTFKHPSRPKVPRVKWATPEPGLLERIGHAILRPFSRRGPGIHRKSA